MQARRILLTLLFGLLTSNSWAAAGGGSVTVGADQDDIFGGDIWHVPGTVNDRQYGPTQIDTTKTKTAEACPYIPYEFANTTTVNSQAAFEAAYAAANPGDAIVVASGTYAWTQVILGRSGTANDPIYIISQDLYGAHFNGTERFDLNGDYQVFAGFRFTNHQNQFTLLSVRGADVRVACNEFNHPAVSDFISVGLRNLEDADPANNFEADNNIFDGNNVTTGEASIVLQDCGTECVSTSRGHHIHHNKWLDMPSTDANEWLVLGVGTLNNPSDTKSRKNVIVENNWIDNWNGDSEGLSIKSSSNVIRNNCVTNTTGFRITVRQGHYNLIYGNWLEGPNSGIRMGSGTGNQAIFNYAGGSGETMFNFRYGSTQSYWPADNAVFRYNVGGNYSYTMKLLNHSSADGSPDGPPENMLVSNNELYAPSWVSEMTQNSGVTSMTYAQWDAVTGNTYENNTINSASLGATTCGDASLFDGPGDEAATTYTPLPQSLETSPISPPSWWDVDLDEPYYIVSTTGNDSTGDGSLANPWRNPEVAVTRLSAGDTLYIREGTYTDHNSSTHVLKIWGQAGAPSGTVQNPITVKSFPGEVATLDGGTTNNSYGASLLRTSNWVFEDLKFTNGGKDCFFSNPVDPADAVSNITVRNSIFLNCANYSTEGCSNSFGHDSLFAAAYVENLTIEGNTFDNSGRPDDTSCDIQPNDNNNHQYRHDHHIYSQAKYTTIRNNVFLRARVGYAIKSDGYQQALGLIGANEFSTVIVNNTFGPTVNLKPYTGIGDEGIGIRGFRNSTSVQYPQKIYIANNLFIDPAAMRATLLTQKGVNAPLDNMILDWNDIFTNEDTPGTECRNNMVSSLSFAGGNDFCGEARGSGYTVTGNTSDIPISSFMFLDYANDDLRIQAGSVADGAGLQNVYVPSTDKDGNPRPNPPSVGAYEVP